jgi:oxygen-independent coproporphyrinogen-3 oxidase
MWLKALKKEISLYKGSFDSFDSLYLGGGTPSILGLKELQEVMDCLIMNFSLTRDMEITIEANPCDLTPAKAGGLKSMGFNRINLGVQSFHEKDLRFLGRGHTVKETEEALTVLRSAGFDNIGMDLIYGLKTQSLKGWKNILERAVIFKPEHLSCYQLTIEEKTLFARMKEKGVIKPLGEEKDLFFFMETSNFLEDKGYIHYEISNFARGSSFYSRHNRKYWQHVPYLGLGPSAHSFRNSRRWWNFRSVRRYCKALQEGKLPIEGREKLTNDQKIMEKIYLGLRTCHGVDINEIGKIPGLSNTISILEDSGHIKIHEQRIMPTKKGLLVADHLPLCFFPSNITAS